MTHRDGRGTPAGVPAISRGSSRRDHPRMRNRRSTAPRRGASTTHNMERFAVLKLSFSRRLGLLGALLRPRRGRMDFDASQTGGSRCARPPANGYDPSRGRPPHCGRKMLGHPWSPPVAQVRSSRWDLSRGLKPTLRCVLAALVVALLAGCDRLDMYDQPRYKPLGASDFFSDGLSARQPVEGTIPRGGLRDDEPFFTGKEAGKLVSQIPEAAFRATHDRDPRQFDQPFDETSQIDLRRALLERGQERFNIYCSVCHGQLGDGDGMIVRRGFRKPPSYHIDRLREAPAGHFYDVMTNGFGAMASYASRIEVADRWAIVAYIRALQLSQNARLEDVPVDQRGALSAPSDEAGQAAVKPGEAAP